MKISSIIVLSTALIAGDKLQIVSAKETPKKPKNLDAPLEDKTRELLDKHFARRNL